MRRINIGISTVCFLFTFLMAMHLFQNWNVSLFEYLYDVSIFTPIFFALLGSICAWFSVRGTNRNILIILNLLMLFFFAIFTFIAIFGFQNP
ncbi:hypothetical protein [Oceanobacillus sp. CFH 90083]|uniref:hypothetical protein n=1 Tax=Oceanobacillus sp. CFH 90083 TaxID=2592336 RepID=UPI00128CFCC6|nr:hypothetical protein [Oceanobacillus sp. CFH 90083]